MAAGEREARQFLLLAIGTRGDAQPLVIIAQRLMRDGHQVRIGVHEKHRDSLEKQGCECFAIEGFDPEMLMANQMGDAPFFTVFGLRELYGGWYRQVCKSTWAAATSPRKDGSPFRAEVIFSSHQQQAATGALAVAERLGAELFFFNTYPMTPTVQFRHPFGTFIEGRDSPDTPIVNKLTYWAYDNANHLGLDYVLRDFRKLIGLPPSLAGYKVIMQRQLNYMKVPCFCIWSPSILPKPKDWHENIVICGNVDRTGGLPDLPADLLQFIKQGEPPVFFGFGPGSMSSEVAIKRSWDAAIGAINNLKCRAILHITPTFRHCISSVPETAFLLDRPVPHSKLFEFCSVSVHHGGPGTLAAALRAGIPNCIVSFVCDNPFWGDRLQNLNVGSHVPSRDVNTAILTKLVQRLFDPSVREACKQMQKQMLQEEDGTEVLVREMYSRLPATGPIKVDWPAKAAGSPVSLISMRNVTSLVLLLVYAAVFSLDFNRIGFGCTLLSIAIVQYFDINLFSQGAFSFGSA